MTPRPAAGVTALGRVVVAFAVGAGAGGLVAARVGFWALVVPVGAVALGAWLEGRVTGAPFPPPGPVRDRTALRPR